jgi:hypothetical protein|tara:strand:+ start:337 stop:582 length:246 start_codon:yes stop_codon:yes gene_type:complete
LLSPAYFTWLDNLPIYKAAISYDFFLKEHLNYVQNSPFNGQQIIEQKFLLYLGKQFNKLEDKNQIFRKNNFSRRGGKREEI